MKTQPRKMKIIVVSPSLNMLGGAQRVCLHAIRALKKPGCKIVLATLDKTDWTLVEKIFGEATKPDEEHYVFPRMPEMPTVTLKQALMALSYVLYLLIITMKNKTNIVINMGGEVADNFGDLAYVNAVPLRLMYIFPEIQPKPGVQWSIYSMLYSKFLTLLDDSAGIIVANSRFIQDIIKRYLGKNAFVINPPGISSRIISESNYKVRHNTVVTVSRFRSAKGLTIIPKIASYIKDCEFLIIGVVDKSSEDCLKDLSAEIERFHVQNRVHIFKNKPYSFTLSALSNAKVFLHTQSTEAFGMSVVESMAAGCVPVVPRAGGPWLEILDQQEGLYGFSYKNPREAADKIRLLINDESLRREISARAAERAMIFDSSTFEKKFLNLVETISCNVNSTPE